MDSNTPPRVKRGTHTDSRDYDAMGYGGRLTDLIDKAPLVVARFDRNGKCLFMNQGAKAITGRSLEYYIGKSIKSLTAHPAELLKECEKGLLAVFETGLRYDWEFSLPRSTGLKHFLTTFFPELDADGTPQHVVLLAMDISNHRATHDSLRESDLRKDRFVAIFAHELRNPLATLRSGLRILQMAPDEEQQEKVGQMMDRQLSHVSRLVNDLLDVSRVSRGQLTFIKTKVLLNDVVTLALETSSHSIQQGRHMLAVSLPEGAVEIMGDLNRLAQVMSNLLDNASKYTPSGGAISLSVVCNKTTVEITIADNGVGIAPDHIDNVFQAFTQVEESRARSRGGLGIGLFLVKAIVEAHDGEIKIESPIGKYKQGTAFTVVLPLAQSCPKPV